MFDPMSLKTDPKSVICIYFNGLQTIPSVNLCTAICYVREAVIYVLADFAR